MCGGFNHLLIACNLLIGEAERIHPFIRGKIAGCVMKAVLGIRLFNIDLHALIGQHFGMNNFGFAVQS